LAVVGLAEAPTVAVVVRAVTGRLLLVNRLVVDSPLNHPPLSHTAPIRLLLAVRVVVLRSMVLLRLLALTGRAVVVLAVTQARTGIRVALQAQIRVAAVVVVLVLLVPRARPLMATSCMVATAVMVFRQASLGPR
jgi:hypothetical protein